MRNLKSFVLVFLIGACASSLAADPVPANRLPAGGNWSGIVGVQGGIPTGQTVFASYTSSVSLSTLNNALATCPSNQVVALAAGTYSLSGEIDITKSGVCLSGATNSSGAPTTIFNGANVVISSGSWDVATASKWNTVGISSGLTRGSSNIVTSSSLSGLSVGSLMWIAAPPTPTGVQGGNWSLFLGSYPYAKSVHVTGISGGTSVTFWPPINEDYLSGSCLACVPNAGTPVHRSGVENISFTGGTGGAYVHLNGADECWIKNVKTYDSSLYHFELYLSHRSEIRHCDISHFENYGNSTYCIISICSCSWLIEDNYFHDCPNVMPMFGVEGSAFVYNYITNVPYATAGWLSQMVFYHGNHCSYILFEGNRIPEHWMDGWNTGSPVESRNSIFFRERIVGWDGSDGGKNQNCHCIVLNDTNMNPVVVGCVMGTPGVTQNYYSTSANGWNFDCLALDTVGGATSTVLDNWNSVDKGIHSGEALSGGQALANSYLYASKPSNFGMLTWPPIDPASPAYSMSETNIPAGYRAVYGVDPPDGSGGSSPPPSPPASFGSPVFQATSPTSGSAPLTVQFSNGLLGGGNCNVNFGDGTIATNVGSAFSHTYQSDGVYTVSLLQTGGASITNYNYITVTN